MVYHAKKNVVKNVLMVNKIQSKLIYIHIDFFTGNTEEEMEEYTEMFEHIDEYRADFKKSSSSSKKSNKKVLSSDSDGSSTDTTTSGNESDASSEEEDVPEDKNKKSKSKSTKKN